MGTPKRYDATLIEEAIDSLVQAIATRHHDTASIHLLGIANGGIVLAERLGQKLRAGGVKCTIGTLDISFHRDDFGQKPIPKEFAPTLIPSDVNGATVILVDDVLYSGRTVKAALDELFDHGRPERVELAVLAERGGRRLPVSADYIGMEVAATDAEKVVVRLDAHDPKRDSILVEPASRTPPLVSPNKKNSRALA